MRDSVLPPQNSMLICRTVSRDLSGVELNDGFRSAYRCRSIIVRFKADWFLELKNNRHLSYLARTMSADHAGNLGHGWTIEFRLMTKVI